MWAFYMGVRYVTGGPCVCVEGTLEQWTIFPVLWTLKWKYKYMYLRSPSI